MIRRVINWTWRLAHRPIMDAVLRIGSRSAVDTALGAAANVVPRAAPETVTQVFNVTLPVTVYIRASHCQVTVCRTDTHKVTLQASMVRSFGLEFATEQDHAGVYIIVRRKPVVGTVARASFTVTVPREAHLAFHLTPGDVVLKSIEGMIELPPA
jgi:hypothetical protein